MNSNTGKRSIKDILNDMHARGGDFANFAEELFDAVNREFAEFANELKSEFSFLLRNNVKEAEETGSEEDVWARRSKEDAELSNDQDEDARLAAEAEKKEIDDEEEPEVEDEDDEEDEYKGYISSRPVDKLQFNIDTVKLANLPGLFNTLKSEGVFFKPIANRWNAGEVDECGVDRLGESSGTLSNALSDLHYCTDSFWVNPKYANKKVGSLGGIGSRVIAEDGKTSVCLWVYYLEKDGTVIAWDMDVD